MTDTKQLIAELRTAHSGHSDEGPSTFSEAADAIESLQADVERLKSALNQQVALVEKCMIAMNENADRGQAAEAERDALQAKLDAIDVAIKQGGQR